MERSQPLNDYYSIRDYYRSTVEYRHLTLCYRINAEPAGECNTREPHSVSSVDLWRRTTSRQMDLEHLQYDVDCRRSEISSVDLRYRLAYVFSYRRCCLPYTMSFRDRRPVGIINGGLSLGIRANCLTCDFDTFIVFKAVPDVSNFAARNWCGSFWNPGSDSECRRFRSVAELLCRKQL